MGLDVRAINLHLGHLVGGGAFSVDSSDNAHAARPHFLDQLLSQLACVVCVVAQGPRDVALYRPNSEAYARASRASESMSVLSIHEQEAAISAMDLTIGIAGNG